MALDSLPNELIGAICDFCSTPDIKSIRLTCSTLRNVADQYFISEVVLSMNRASLEACKGIAAHPVFSKTARSLWIDAELQKVMTFSDWDQERKRRIRHIARLRIERERLGGESQTPTVMNSEEEPESRLDALAETKRGEPGEDQLWFDYIHAAHLAYESDQMLRDQSLFSTIRNVLSCCAKIEEVTLSAETDYQENFDDHSGVDVMAQLVLAASAVNFKPRQLYLEHLSPGFLSREDIADKAHEFFRGVKELRWEFFFPELNLGVSDTDFANANVRRHFNTGNFAKLVQAAALMENIHVNPPMPLEISTLVGDYHWQQLTHIDLVSFDTWQTQLVGFLLNHRSTLKSVSLTQVWLEDGSWPECFARIAGKLPQVTSFELQGLFSDWSREADHVTDFYDFGYGDENGNPDKYAGILSEYLIKGGGEFPPKPEQMQQAEDDTTS